MNHWLSDLVWLFDPETAARWLTTPHPRLTQSTPIEAIREHRQADVARIIDQIAAGAYL